MDVDPESTEPQRTAELWFDDGNIVLQAGRCQYRVYRGILAAFSSVFRDMLTFPQPPDSELVENCPLVRLHDSAAEVTVFLRAIFDSSFFMPFPATTTIEIIVGCLRLSHKYGVDYLCRRALVHLSSGFDTNLSCWDRGSMYGGDGGYPEVEKSSWKMQTVHPTYMIIKLAREVGALWILPDALYCLANEIGHDIFRNALYKGITANFSLADQEAFFRGHRIQTQCVTTDILRFLSHPVNITECSGDNFGHPCCGTTNLGGEWELLDDVCSTCLKILEKTHGDARQAFWDRLPEIYGLPPWEELEKMKVAAIGHNWIS
ncbi:hypothetical protein B0H19DRAFT_1271093 [Mycena capillaripes]|nr:hypothetical protein B0H19DRAFT_1271093 [Mycena capillaripes]